MLEVKEMFCPDCGNKLKPSSWQGNNPKCQTLVCDQNHLWDIWTGISLYDLCFERVATANCALHPFTLTMPERKMRKGKDDQWLCPECFEQQRQVWRMDSATSYARLEVTPVRTTEGVVYRLEESIKINPYPNPFMYGGKFGGGCARNEEELDQAKVRFQKETDELRKNGMEKVEVITHDETVHVEQPKLETVKTAPKVETAQQPKLMEVKPEPKAKVSLLQASLL
jgi:hypothetical protein